MGSKKVDKKTLYKLLGIALIGVIMIIFMIKFAPQIIELAKKPQVLADYLSSFGVWGFLVFILLEVVQVIIAIIPGDIFHIAAGFIYKMPLGFILAFFGEMLGALIAFGLAKYFGSDIVKKFVSQARIEQISKLINSAKGTIGILVLCLIPFIPKDILLYVAGITPVKSSRFLTVFLLCRIPDIFIKSSGGAAIYEKDYVGLIIILAAFLAFIGIGFLLKKKFIKNENEAE